jgi:hypothetical protein
MTAVARIGFGADQALAFRYRPYSLFFYLGMVALLFALYSVYRAEATQSRRGFRIASALAGSLALFAWLACWIDGRTQQQALAVRNRTLLHALQWSEAMPDNPDLKFLFPRPEILRQTAASLRARSLLPVPLVAPAVVAKLSRASAELEKTRIGRFESCAFDTQGRLGVSGRVERSAGQKPLTHVVFGATDSSGGVKLFAVTPLRRESALPDELCFARSFSPAHLAPGEFIILAWAIDSTNENAYPLASVSSHGAPTRFATH